MQPPSDKRLNPLFLEWMRKRSITEEAIRDAGIYGETEIVIPIRDMDGVFSFNKYRRSPLKEDGPKYWYDKGGRLTLYGGDRIAEGDEIVVTEGEMDALVCLSANMKAVSSTGGALSFEKQWLDYFRLKDIGAAFCFDNDSAGGEGMARVWMADKGVRLVFLPDRAGVKDISEYVMGGGDLGELMKTARGYADETAIREDKAQRAALWKSTYFHDAALKMLEKARTMAEQPEGGEAGAARRARGANGDKVMRAKMSDMRELLKFGPGGNAACIFHKEKTGSLHYYEKENRAFCFGGCGRGYDPIDVYRQLNNCSFKEAVEALQ